MTIQNSTADINLYSTIDQPDQGYLDRRSGTIKRKNPGLERRQFSDSHANLSPEAAELGRAIDQYKLENHRRYISYEEMLMVIKSLGYSK